MEEPVRALAVDGSSDLLPLSQASVLNPEPPDQRVKLIFIHHSSGENWLADDNGGLGLALNQNNYFVSDTNYGWGPDSIGDRTDIPNWPEWFRSSHTPTYMNALFNENDQHASYTRTLANPGGQNQIVMFKSCFPNSDLTGNPGDPPTAGGWLTVGHAKYVYNEILEYFATQPNKLFIVITAPPLLAAHTTSHNAANARAFNNWLVNDWLAENHYTLKNVAVFDFYNVLTYKDNHHRFRNGQIEHVYVSGRNTAYYPSSQSDDHPSATGNRKATTEFISLLNIFYHRWAEEQSTPTLLRPSGSVGTHRPTFRWGAFSGAERYRLAVWSSSAAAYVYVNYVNPSSCTSMTCAFTLPGIDLVNGSYKFKVLAVIASGNTLYSGWMSFKVSSSLPLAPILINPSGAVTTHRPRFRWDKVSGATSYKLMVYSNASRTYVINTTVPTSACGATTCSYTPTSDLPNGAYKFKMLTNNSHGASGYSSAYMNFTISAP
jgi:hypothetical protein